MEWKRRGRPRSINKLHIIVSLSIFVLSFCSQFSNISSLPTCRDFAKRREEESVSSLRRRGTSLSLARRILGGPGSWPPQCTSKCNNCTPCKPVHVPVPPGTPVTTEYYPERWRCKCGNKLYMP